MIKTSMITIIIKRIELCANDMISLSPAEIFKEFSVLMKFSFFLLTLSVTEQLEQLNTYNFLSTNKD